MEVLPDKEMAVEENNEEKQEEVKQLQAEEIKHTIKFGT